MKAGFYISMGIAIAGLAVGFILLNDIQREKEAQDVWVQKIPTQCNDVWGKEYSEFFEINPELSLQTRQQNKEILENIIKTHYERQGIKIIEINLKLDFYEGMRCEACTCLGWDMLEMKIPESQLELMPKSEGWEPRN